jgi:DNA polymerase III sliding clamp (beta) subunit (PCNA family)
VTAVEPELGEATEDVELEFTGGDIELGLNRPVRQDVLPSSTGKGRHRDERDPEPDARAAAGDDGYRCVVMPMRL